MAFIQLFGAACSAQGSGNAGAGGATSTSSSESGLGGIGGLGGAGGAADEPLEGVATICFNVCDSLQQRGCLLSSFEDCVTNCIETFVSVPECARERAVYEQCLIDERTADCAEPAVCAESLAAWQYCTTGGCVDVLCSPKNGGCSCKGTCLDRNVTVECVPNDDEGATCTCKEGSTTVGTCQSELIACFPSKGCCAPLLNL
ncbi:hypothetical protein [Chondromyces crocatus]|uniref:hypothetical protein n=1 Tax=Chondromyces crocatus TaxID=52 RepID=UPI0012E1C2C3|nr:hypothetical protein [Chondromyces crocatus]